MSEPDVFSHPVANTYADLLRLRPSRDRADADKPFRHSNAGGCSKALAFAAADVAETDEPDVPGLWAMHLGTLIHDDVQAAWAELLPELEAEVEVGWAYGSGHADAGSDAVTVELKTMGAPGYDIAIGVWRANGGKRKDPSGPKPGHLMQGAINAACRGSDELVIVYLCLDPIGRTVADRLGLSERERFMATWSYPRAVYEPWAWAEQERVARIIGQVDAGELPAPSMPETPDGSVVRAITKPGEENWPCAYCRWRSLCPAVATVAEAREAGTKGAA